MEKVQTAPGRYPIMFNDHELKQIRASLIDRQDSCERLDGHQCQKDLDNALAKVQYELKERGV